MFSIVISEKGGAERRESFDKNEINVGRVQGNDLMLPKGNVSKHHARLLYRDGRFIVTDLKSTNGTYVNGRKIAQATIVREGDKIYIGDFVLRLDTAGADATPMGEIAQPHASADDGRAISRTGPGGVATPGIGASQGAAMPAGGIGARPVPLPPLPIDTGAPHAFPGAPAPGIGPGVPLSPLHDSDGETGAAVSPQQMAVPKMPGAPRVPTALSPAQLSGTPSPAGLAGSRGATVPLPQTQSSPPAPRVSSAGGAVSAPVPSPQQVSAPRPSGPSASSGSSPSRVPPRETPHQTQRRQALTALVERLSDSTDFAAARNGGLLDDATVQRLERALREQAQAMRSHGEIPEGVDLDGLLRDVLREMSAFGPLGPLLEDDDVTEIHVMRHEYVLAVRGGVLVPAEAPLTSEAALRRIIVRLAQQSGEPVREGEHVVERRLLRGAHMMALLPPTSSAPALVIRKRRRLDMSLEDFVRLGGLSRAMATFLENCITARANIIVCGSHGQAVASFVAALANATPPGERVAVVQEVEEIAIQHAHLVSLALGDGRARSEEAIRAAAKLRADRLIVTSLGGSLAAATVEAISEGAEGVLAALAAPTLRQGISRLVAQVLLGRTGMSVESARECVGESFDIALEVAPLADGRHRVIRMAEFGGADAKGVVLRDLFTAAPEGPEGAFAATGVVPRVVGEFSQRGVKVDPNLFKRSIGRA